MKDVKAILGDSVKASRVGKNSVSISGKGVLIDEHGGETDLTMEYFTKETDFGIRNGDRSEAMFHHGIPLIDQWDKMFLGFPESAYKTAKRLSVMKFSNPVRTSLEEEGKAIVAELILDMRKEYEAYVADLAGKGLLSWSSGAIPQLVDKDDLTGEIKRWPIMEFSLTPTPAEPRTSVSTGKSLGKDMVMRVLGVDAKDITEEKDEVGDVAIKMAMAKLRLAKQKSLGTF